MKARKKTETTMKNSKQVKKSVRELVVFNAPLEPFNWFVGTVYS